MPWPQDEWRAQRRKQLVPRTLSAKLAVQDTVQPAIETSTERAVVQHGQIVRVLPVLLAAQLVLHGGEKARAGQWIRHGHADVVGAAIAHHLQGLFNVLARLARIAELQEETNFDARRV